MKTYKFSELPEKIKEKALRKLAVISVIDYVKSTTKEVSEESIMKQCKYLTSNEGLMDTIQCNDYLFTEEGKIV